jgi:dihydroorotase
VRLSRLRRLTADGFILRGGMVVDPARGVMYPGDVRVVMDNPPYLLVARAGMFPRRMDISEEVIGLDGLWVAPGLLDIHVHFRTPGQEHKEDIASGSRAAAAGGFCTVVCEPNTDPPIDSEERVRAVLDRAKTESVVNLYQKMAVTVGQLGEELTEFASAKSAAAFSDDGQPILDNNLMREALRRAKAVGKPLMVHDEASPATLARLRKRYPSARRYEYEPKLVQRDLRLVAETGCPLHFSHLSMERSLRMIRRAKERGLPVTCEVTPHHAELCRECEPVPRRSPNWKTNPPLRGTWDSITLGLADGLLDGSVDALATDHAPHSPEEKSLSRGKAPFGVIGLETALGSPISQEMVQVMKRKKMTLSRRMVEEDEMIRRIRVLTIGPARLWRRRPGTPAWEVPSLKAPGWTGWEKRSGYANLTVIDPHREWTVDPEKFYSKGRNTPFATLGPDGKPAIMHGRAVMTIVRGRIVMHEGEVALRRTQGHPERSRGIC